MLAAIEEDEIGCDDFDRVELRVGTVTIVKEFPEARRPAYQLWIDFGAGVGVRMSSAQITAIYRPEELVGRQVIAVVNFPAKQMGAFRSEASVTGVYDADGTVVFAQPKRPAPNGARLA